MAIVNTQIIRAAKEGNATKVLNELKGRVPLHDLSKVASEILKTLAPVRESKKEKKSRLQWKT